MILMCLVSLQLLVPSVVFDAPLISPADVVTRTNPSNRVFGRGGGSDSDGFGVSTRVRGDEERR
jgi:hypothetical protein